MCENLYRAVQIGDVKIEGNLFLAPMAGYSDCAFRQVCREAGANLADTEMASAEAISRGSEKTDGILRRAAGERVYAAQIFGAEPQTMAAAARIVLQRHSPEILDINAGCPVPKVVKTGAGAALTRDFARLGAIVEKVARECEKFSVPVTVKIRSGWDSNPTFLQAAQAAFDSGAKAVALHSRSRSQGYEGRANREFLAELAQKFCGKMAVFGSGDVFSPEDARDILRQTKCDAVMFARGATGNPFVFGETRALLVAGKYEKPDFSAKMSAAFRELDFLAAEKGEKTASLEMRKRFCAYLKGEKNAASLREKICKCQNVKDYKEALFEANFVF